MIVYLMVGIVIAIAAILAFAAILRDSIGAKPISAQTRLRRILNSSLRAKAEIGIGMILRPYQFEILTWTKSEYVASI